jgi:hypothetical protein
VTLQASERPCLGNSKTIASGRVENTALLTMARSCSNIGLSDRPALIERFPYPQRRVPDVKPVTRDKNRLKYRPWLVLAVVFVCVLFHGGPASASSISQSNPFDLDAHSQHCKCRTKCRGSSCCCGPAGAASRPFGSEPDSQDSEPDAGPCVNSGPCGNSGLPGSSSVGPHLKIATLSKFGRIQPATRERLFPSTFSCILPARRASRIDKPPESRVVA